MFVEFLGLPGSGKSTLIDMAVRSTANTDCPVFGLNQFALNGLRTLKAKPGYVRRRPERGWFFGTFMFAQDHPELFRIAFENTLLNMSGHLDFLDLLGQYYFAKVGKTTEDTILVDEGLLHRGAAAFLYDNAYSDLETYLSLVPRPDVVVLLNIDTATAIARCKQRPKGMPKLYREVPESDLTAFYERISDLQKRCIVHQSRVGTKVVHLDAMDSLEENVQRLLSELVNAKHRVLSGEADSGRA